MINIVLCGGSGTRLWPISRSLMPKQFVKLFNNKSLFQLTIERNRSICKEQFIVTNIQQYFLAVDQLEEIQSHANYFLLEPFGKNTAPAIAMACFALDPNEIILATPSDHLIKNINSYKKLAIKAKKLAKLDYLVTIGVEAKHPETGYGYIEANGEDVKAFHEKPDKETAKKYIEAGNFYWNSGIFCFKAGVFLEELKKYAPKIYKTSKIAYENSKKDTIIRITHDDMADIPEKSIDCAVMEKSHRIKVISDNLEWSDLGSFDALTEEFPKDTQGNTVNKNLIAIDSRNNFVYGESRLISLIGINDLIIIDTPDALLVSKKGDSQKIKEIVKELKKRESDLHYTHLTTHRPWGTYTILDNKDKYKIKRIVVKPGKRLSLQKHFHRSEHWIVVSGTATVTIGKKTQLIRPNESIYIKMGEVHRLANEGKIDVVLIEAQVGEYTGEDDIVRIEDDYEGLFE